MAIILVLAGLILGTSGYVQKKGARSRAEAEIAAISAACESYKADIGVYPHAAATDSLDARTMLDPINVNATQYQSANLVLYRTMSGDRNLDRAVSAADESVDIDGSTLATPLTQLPKSYFACKPNQLAPTDQSASVQFIRDPFGNTYGYSTAYQSSPSTGYNPTFDLWSTGGSNDPAQWIKNW
jgi:type II secretory pathway pseudopilin PulG